MTIQRVLVATGSGFAVVNSTSVPSGATQLCSYGAPRPDVGTVTPTVPVNVDEYGRISFYVSGAWLSPFSKDDAPAAS